MVIPFRRSRSRAPATGHRPSRGVCRTPHPPPAGRSRARSPYLHMQSWNQFRPVGLAAATSSTDAVPSVESEKGIPLPTAAAPHARPLRIRRVNPVGAMPNGSADRPPRTLDVGRPRTRRAEPADGTRCLERETPAPGTFPPQAARPRSRTRPATSGASRARGGPDGQRGRQPALGEFSPRKVEPHERPEPLRRGRRRRSLVFCVCFSVRCATGGHARARQRMQRVRFLLRIKPEHREEYLARREDVWPECSRRSARRTGETLAASSRRRTGRGISET